MSGAQHLVRADSLSYAYPGTDTAAITDISFSVKKGSIFGLLGPSGAGKSTIQRILTRQIRRLDSGHVEVLGRSIEEWDHSLFERLGVVFELPNHYPKLTALENLEFFSSFYQSATQAPIALLRLVGLEDAADRRVEAFSKGMQVRLNFARALLHDPELLFLDEPTTGLDPTTASMMRDVISALKAEGKTIILTTHNMYDAEQLCDEVGFLANGSMVLVDTPTALRMQHGSREVEVALRTESGLETHTFSLDGLRQNGAFLDLLENPNLETIHSQEASLDKVFQIVTGQSLGGGD